MLRLVVLTLIVAACDAGQQPPPIVQFKGLVASFSGSPRYDNTTCKGRCCNKVEVHSSSSECDNDWTRCADRRAGSVLPQCSSTLTSGCSAWVPCVSNTRVSFYVPWGILFALSFLAFWSKFCGLGLNSKVQDSFGSVFAMFCICTKVILFSVALVPISDYRHWISHTQTSLEFVAYQRCVAYCTSLQDATVVKTRFCEDEGLNLLGLDVFLSGRGDVSQCSIGGDENVRYCKSCYSKKDEWQTYRTVVVYLEARAYVEWGMLFVLGGLRYLERYEIVGCASDLAYDVFVVAFKLYIASQIGFFGSDVYMSDQSVKLRVIQYMTDTVGFPLPVVVNIEILCIALAISDFAYIWLALSFLRDLDKYYEGKKTKLTLWGWEYNKVDSGFEDGNPVVRIRLDR